MTEAELVLDVALRLEKLLAERAGRRGDPDAADRRVRRRCRSGRRSPTARAPISSCRFTPTPARTRRPRGVETYFLNFATNLSAAAVAARENAASGQAMGALPDFVKAIALNNKLDESRDFATYVQRAMVERLTAGRTRTLKDLGVKQAPFVVLIGAAMPSVLAEISFLTNAQEAKLLQRHGLPAADRRSALRRDPEVPDVAEDRRDGRRSSQRSAQSDAIEPNAADRVPTCTRTDARCRRHAERDRTPEQQRRRARSRCRSRASAERRRSGRATPSRTSARPVGSLRRLDDPAR